MHDPMTVAFEIKRPWPKVYDNGHRYWPALVVIWHVDPERGSDDSCDWHGNHRRLNAREKSITEAMWDLETLLDNRPHFPDSREHKAFQVLKSAVWKWQERGWRLHPRWHIWHWRIRVPFLTDFKRWLWSRCMYCGQRYRWGYAPTTGNWNSAGPRWFRGEKDTYHSDCSRPRFDGALCANTAQQKGSGGDSKP